MPVTVDEYLKDASEGYSDGYSNKTNSIMYSMHGRNNKHWVDGSIPSTGSFYNYRKIK